MNKQWSLYIDTSDIHTARVVLRMRDMEYSAEESSRLHTSQTVLLMIDRLLKIHAIHLSDIVAVYVHQGPGSYTGLRVGAAVANMLSRLLQIPVNGQRSLAFPVYT